MKAKATTRKQSRKSDNNGKNNGKQRAGGKQVGGVTGRGFVPGQSGNPNGRPRTKGLLNALKSAVGQEQDGRTVEERLVEVLVQEALHGKNRLAAVQAIFDRIEGKPKQQVDLNDITKRLEGRTTEELLFYAKHGAFPEEQSQNGDEHEGN